MALLSNFFLAAVFAVFVVNVNAATVIDDSEQIITTLKKVLSDKGIDVDKNGLFDQSLSEIFPEEAECVTKVIEGSDAATQAVYANLVEEAQHWVKLNVDRDAALAECDQIGGATPTVVQIQQQRLCRSQVYATYNVQITVSNVKIRAYALQLTKVWAPLYSCVRHLL